LQLIVYQIEPIVSQNITKDIYNIEIIVKLAVLRPDLIKKYN